MRKLLSTILALALFLSPVAAQEPVFIQGSLPAFAAIPAFTISGTLPAFASTPAFTISGTLPAFAATPTVNLGTIAGAALAANQPTNAAQGSTTVGQTGILTECAVTTGAPAYTTGQTSPCSLDPSGNLRVNASFSGTSDTVAGPSALGSLNAAVTVSTNGQAGAGFQLAAGTLIGTLTPEISYDGGTTWVSTLFYDPITLTTSNTLVFGSANTAATKTIVIAGGTSTARVRVSAYTSGTANATARATDNPTPSNALGIQGSNPGVAPPATNNTLQTQNPSLDPCQTQAHGYTTVNLTTTATIPIITHTTGKKTYICSMDFGSGVTVTVTVGEGTGSNCSTGFSNMFGQPITLTTPYLQWHMGNGTGSVAQALVASDDICISEGATAVIGGQVTWVQQ